MGKQILTVFRKPKYLLLATTVAVLVFTFAIWLPNLSLLAKVLHPDSAGSIAQKAGFVWSLYGSISTNFTVLSASYTIVIAVLFGVNISLLAYYITRMRGGVRSVSSTSAAGLSGLVSGIFGIGCAACGTFILTSVLAVFGATGFLAWLPFGGEEFGLLGVGLLLYSIFLLDKKINDPLVCEIK